MPVKVLVLLGALLPVADARGQVLTGRLYPEKEIYLVEEPVFIVLEIANTGDQTAWIESRLGEPCIERDQIEVVDSRYRGFGSDTSFGCFGGVAGSCASGLIELKPGEQHSARIFLSGRFQMDEARIYQVHARRRVPIYQSEAMGPESSSGAEFSDDFEIALIHGSEEDLRAVYEPFIKGLNSSDPRVQWEATQVITDMAPLFLEDVILGLADLPNRAGAAIPGLGRLYTTRAKQKLADLAENSREEWNQQAAIRALAKTRDPTYLPVLVRIAHGSAGGTRNLAIQTSGLLGGDDAVPFLVSALRSSDVHERVAAVRGLGITASRSAVPVVIAALQDSDVGVFGAATQSLAQLTHYSITGTPWNETPSAETSSRWLSWWQLKGFAAPIYSTDTCVQPELLR